MAGGRYNGDDDLISDINITPFVDVVLVLLVIFMVTAGIMVHRGLSVELPQAATAEELQGQMTLEVVIARDGTIELNGARVDLERLKELGREGRQRKEKIVVSLSADKGVSYETVVSVMDAFRQVGVTEFGLELEKSK